MPAGARTRASPTLSARRRPTIVADATARGIDRIRGTHRRLKADLRRLGEAFPERIVEAIPIAGLPEHAPELELARRLAAYGDLREKRIERLPSQKASLAKLAFVGLQQRQLSS